MEPERIRKLFDSQLFTLTVLDIVRTHNQLNAEATEACDNAAAVAAQTLDKLVADMPELAATAIHFFWARLRARWIASLRSQ